MHLTIVSIEYNKYHIMIFFFVKQNCMIFVWFFLPIAEFDENKFSYKLKIINNK